MADDKEILGCLNAGEILDFVASDLDWLVFEDSKDAAIYVEDTYDVDDVFCGDEIFEYAKNNGDPLSWAIDNIGWAGILDAVPTAELEAYLNRNRSS